MLPGMHQLEPLRLGGTGVVTTKEGGPPRRVEEPARLLEGRRHGVNIRILRNLKVPERVWANMGVSAPPPRHFHGDASAWRERQHAAGAYATPRFLREALLSYFRNSNEHVQISWRLVTSWRQRFGERGSVASCGDVEKADSVFRTVN